MYTEIGRVFDEVRCPDKNKNININSAISIKPKKRLLHILCCKKKKHLISRQTLWKTSSFWRTVKIIPQKPSEVIDSSDGLWSLFIYIPAKNILANDFTRHSNLSLSPHIFFNPWNISKQPPNSLRPHKPSLFRDRLKRAISRPSLLTSSPSSYQNAVQQSVWDQGCKFMHTLLQWDWPRTQNWGTNW